MEGECKDESLQQGRGNEGEEEDGVLLYYKYAEVPDVPSLVRLYQSNCESLGLLGRIRIAPDGVNVTIGGKMASLERHIEVMKADSLFQGTDFKLASCRAPRDGKIARECGFTSLAIRVVKELVTFGSHPLLKSPSISNAGRHLSATEFHSVLSDAGNKPDCDGSMEHKRLILLDARNIYETRIGMFHKSHVETLNPEIRQYSDLPTWIDENSDQLKGNRVLMYCTGGIRCEMASAYIRSKGSGFETVFQLYGGIQRYLEQFPDGGFFRGKNFVFDHRISVGSEKADILGSCMICGDPFDDYSARCRCYHCRMLVLVCDGCQGTCNKTYVCELCQKHEMTGVNRPVIALHEDGQLQESVSSPKSLPAEVDFSAKFTHVPTVCDLSGNDAILRKMPSKKLRILCLHGFRQNASGFKGRMASFTKKLKYVAEFVFIDAAHELPFIYQQCQTEMNPDSAFIQSSPPPDNCRRRFAWLVVPQANDPGDQHWRVADGPFDPFQYQHQTDGLESSCMYLRDKIVQLGPFDGILGFSQGAAMAALFCEQLNICDSPDLKFAVLCSGFSLFSRENKTGNIMLPSLHVFGSSKGGDKQIDCAASRELASLFDPSCSKIVEHEMGHIIPAKQPHIGEIHDFLSQFL